MKILVFLTLLVFSCTAEETEKKKRHLFGDFGFHGHGKLFAGGPVDFGHKIILGHKHYDHTPSKIILDTHNHYGSKALSSHGLTLGSKYNGGIWYGSNSLKGFSSYGNGYGYGNNYGYGNSYGYGHHGTIDLGAHVDKHIVVTKKIGIPVPQPYPVHIEKKIPVPVPHPVAVPVEKPYPVHIPKPYPVPVEKPVPYPVEKPVPYPVKVEVKVPVKVPVPIAVPHPVPVTVHKPVPVAVPVPVPVHHHVPVAVHQPIVHHSIPLVHQPIVQHYEIERPVSVISHPAPIQQLQQPIAYQQQISVQQPVLYQQQSYVQQPQAVAVGSGSLGVVKLSNGKYVLGSGSLGYTQGTQAGKYTIATPVQNTAKNTGYSYANTQQNSYNSFNSGFNTQSYESIGNKLQQTSPQVFGPAPGQSTNTNKNIGYSYEKPSTGFIEGYGSGQYAGQTVANVVVQNGYSVQQSGHEDLNSYNSYSQNSGSSYDTSLSYESSTAVPFCGHDYH